MLRSRTDAILTMNEEDFRIATKGNLAIGPIIPTFGMGVYEPKPTKKANEIRMRYASPDNFVMLFVGELSKRKNQAFLIDSFKKVKEYVPNAKLWLVGGGHEEAALTKKIELLGLSEDISLFGNKKNPEDFMAACDVYVSPSLGEGLPFNIVEALGCKKTVIASDIKGHRDILAGGAGILFKAGNTEDFARQVLDVHNGNVKISARKIHVGFRNFSFDSVFYDTYDKIKEAGWL